MFQVAIDISNNSPPTSQNQETNSSCANDDIKLNLFGFRYGQQANGLLPLRAEVTCFNRTAVYPHVGSESLGRLHHGQLVHLGQVPNLTPVAGVISVCCCFFSVKISWTEKNNPADFFLGPSLMKSLSSN